MGSVRRVLAVPYAASSFAFFVWSLVQLAQGTHSWFLWLALVGPWGLVLGLVVELVRARRGTEDPNRAPSLAELRRTQEKELARQQRVINKLYEEYKLVGRDMTAEMLAKTAPLPKDWVERRLQEMGEGFRYTRYLPD